MSRNRIEDFGPYQDAVRLFDHVVEDMELLRSDPRCYRLIGQQVGSVDLADKIIAQLTRTIQTLRANGVAEDPTRHAVPNTPYASHVREPPSTYGSLVNQDTVTDEEIHQLFVMFQ